MSSSHRCPSCRGTDVRGTKFGFGDRSLYEFGCNRCGLSEDKNDQDPDFLEWYGRWSGQRKARKSAVSAASQAEKGQEPRKPIESVQPVLTDSPKQEDSALPRLVIEKDKNKVQWPERSPNLLIWSYLSELDLAALKLDTVEVFCGLRLLVTVKLDLSGQAIAEITVHSGYFPSDQDFYDWKELFRFNRLKKLYFKFYCQWISVPDIPEGTWPLLELIDLYVYSQGGYHNFIGQETRQLQKILPKVAVREFVDGPAWP